MGFERHARNSECTRLGDVVLKWVSPLRPLSPALPLSAYLHPARRGRVSPCALSNVKATKEALKTGDHRADQDTYVRRERSIDQTLS